MTRIYSNRTWKLFSLLLCLTMLSSCYSQRKYDYYSDIDNYICVKGVISSITYNDDHSSMYLEISSLSQPLDDNSFKIVGDSLSIVQNNGIDTKIKINDAVSFMTAPKYFGDGYVMPIVAISVDGESLLDFEVGHKNLMNWLKNGG